MAVLNISPEAVDEAREWNGGIYPIAKEGVGIPFEVLGDEKKPRFLDAKIDKMGVSYESFIVSLATVDEHDQEIIHSEFFRLDEEMGISKWKAYLSGLHGKTLTGAEIAAFDTDNLVGVRYTADVNHNPDKRDPKRIYANTDYKTIAPEGDGLAAPEAPKPSKPARPASSRR